MKRIRELTRAELVAIANPPRVAIARPATEVVNGRVVQHAGTVYRLGDGRLVEAPINARLPWWWVTTDNPLPKEGTCTSSN